MAICNSTDPGALKAAPDKQHLDTVLHQVFQARSLLLLLAVPLDEVSSEAVGLEASQRALNIENTVELAGSLLADVADTLAHLHANAP